MAGGSAPAAHEGLRKLLHGVGMALLRREERHAVHPRG